nr:TetR-like C-terminal domain-containing protein [Isoptericola chiayiensis]
MENLLISDGFEELTSALLGALEGTVGRDVVVIGQAYRDFARRHPHLYRLMTERELDRDGLTPGVETAAARPLVEALHGDETRARAVFAFMHGMTSLELRRRFPPGADLDAAWAVGLAQLAADPAPPTAS